MSTEVLRSLYYIFMSNGCFMLSGPHVVLLHRVLDFALHRTIYYSSGGLSVQSVSRQFRCQRLCEIEEEREGRRKLNVLFCPQIPKNLL